jgi:hypothetical protein
MDNKTTDKGWAAMRQLLDREMPEKHNHRRIVWWWLSLLLLPAAGLGAWYWSNTGEAPSEPQAIAHVSDASINSLDAQTQQNAVDVHQNEPSSSSNFSNKTIQSPQKTQKDPGTRLKKSGSVYQLANSASSAASAAFEVQNTGENTLNNVEGLPFATNEINPSETPQLDLGLISVNAQIIDYQSNNTPNIAKIPADRLPKIIPKTPEKTWTFGATSVVTTERFNSLNGFSTGLNVDWKFARKWGLRTGLFYNIHTPQVKDRPVATVNSADYTSNVDGSVIVVNAYTGAEVLNSPGNNFYNDSLSGNILIPVSRLQLLEIPVTFFWQPSRAMKVIGGVSIARTLTAKADHQNYAGDYILRLNDKAATDDASKLSSNEFSRWNAAAMLGAGFAVGKSFEIGLTAKMPFSSFKSILADNSDNPLATPNSAFSTNTGKTKNTPSFSLYGTLFF